MDPFDVASRFQVLEQPENLDSRGGIQPGHWTQIGEGFFPTCVGLKSLLFGGHVLSLLCRSRYEANDV